MVARFQKSCLLLPGWLVVPVSAVEAEDEPCSLEEFTTGELGYTTGEFAPVMEDWLWCCEQPGNAERGSCARGQPPVCLAARTAMQDEATATRWDYDKARAAWERCCDDNDDPQPACHEREGWVGRFLGGTLGVMFACWILLGCSGIKKLGRDCANCLCTYKMDVVEHFPPVAVLSWEEHQVQEGVVVGASVSSRWTGPQPGQASVPMATPVNDDVPIPATVPATPVTGPR